MSFFEKVRSMKESSSSEIKSAARILEDLDKKIFFTEGHKNAISAEADLSKITKSAFAINDFHQRWVFNLFPEKREGIINLLIENPDHAEDILYGLCFLQGNYLGDRDALGKYCDRYVEILKKAPQEAPRCARDIARLLLNHSSDLRFELTNRIRCIDAVLDKHPDLANNFYSIYIKLEIAKCLTEKNCSVIASWLEGDKASEFLNKLNECFDECSHEKEKAYKNNVLYLKEFDAKEVILPTNSMMLVDSDAVLTASSRAVLGASQLTVKQPQLEKLGSDKLADSDQNIASLQQQPQ